MSQSLNGARRASYLLVPLALLVAARCGLIPALIAGLFAFMLLDQSEKALRGAGASARPARWISVGLFFVVAGLLAVIFASFVRIGVARLPLLLDRALPRLNALADRFGVDFPADNVSDLRALILETVKEHANAVTSAGGLLTREFFQIVGAVAAAVLRFVAVPSPEEEPRRGAEADFLRECGARASLFMTSFERVMGAQILIAAINAGVAAVFLFALQVPFRTMLTLTAFVCGLVPLVGNLVSNSLIVAAALTLSDRLALAALVFLVVVHKGEYFLNSRIVGSRIALPMWATLAGLLIGEALLGAGGVILAPTLICYFREELRVLPARA